MIEGNNKWAINGPYYERVIEASTCSTRGEPRGMRNGRSRRYEENELEIAYELRQFNESNVFPSRSTEWIHDLWTIVASRIGHSCNIHPKARFRVHCQLAARIFPLSLPPPPILRTRCLSYRCVKGIKSLSRSRLIYHAINVRARKSLAGRRRGRNARSSFLDSLKVGVFPTFPLPPFAATRIDRVAYLSNI